MKQPKYKICRRLGAQVFGKCENPKFLLRSGKASPNKNAGKRKPRQFSEFGLQLLEKQKARFLYGMRERQFSNYVKKAASTRGVNPSHELHKMLEARLDNVVYRLGFAKTRALARQMVSHGHIIVDGKKITFPSYQVKPGNVVGIREGSRGNALFSNLGEKLGEHKGPSWLSIEKSKKEGTVVSEPGITDEGESLFSFASVIEFYSR